MRDIQQPAFDAPASDWQVYGDALQEAGDPRGELIALNHAIAQGRGTPATRDAHVKQHWATLVGDVSPDDLELAWHYSVLRGVTVKVKQSSGELVTKLLALPVARELRRFELRGIGTVDLAAAMTVLAERAPTTCTEFAFVDQRAAESKMLVSRDFDPPANLVTMGTVEPFWKRATSIAIDVADSGQLQLGAIDAPKLRSFALRCLRFCDWETVGDAAALLGAARWPELESFELRCVEMWLANLPEEDEPYVAIYSAPDYEGRDDTDDGDTEGVEWGELVPVLSTLAKCPLRRLALTSFASADSMLEAIATAGLAPTVRELDLSDSELGDPQVTWLVSHPQLFRQLDRLVLERTRLSDGKVSTLSKLGPTIQHSQSTGATYRYVVGQE